jgi:hypothetical protein
MAEAQYFNGGAEEKEKASNDMAVMEVDGKKLQQLRQAIGAELRRRRKAKGWTLQTVADATNLTFRFLSTLEPAFTPQVHH